VKHLCSEMEQFFNTALVLNCKRLLHTSAEHLEMKVTLAQQPGRFFFRLMRVVVYFILYVL